MRLAAAGLAQEVDDLMAIDELQLGQREDPVAIQRRLEAKVEAGQRLDAEQPPHLERRFHPAAFAKAEFLAQQRINRLERADLAAFELADRVVENLQRPRHLQPDQVPAHLIDGARHGWIALHARPPAPARRRATAS
jgi:hypothetical protein